MYPTMREDDYKYHVRTVSSKEILKIKPLQIMMHMSKNELTMTLI